MRVRLYATVRGRSRRRENGNVSEGHGREPAFAAIPVSCCSARPSISGRCSRAAMSTRHRANARRRSPSLSFPASRRYSSSRRRYSICWQRSSEWVNIDDLPGADELVGRPRGRRHAGVAPLRICIIGKYPPIQGGVSMRTYWTAHSLASRGHEVHVVTNAKEVQPPFRMHMRAQDWQRCEAQFECRIGNGSLDRSRSTGRSPTFRWRAPSFPSSPTIAARVHAERPFDVIFSHYLEPYGVAGHLASQMTGRAACRSHGRQRRRPLVATSAIGSDRTITCCAPPMSWSRRVR